MFKGLACASTCSAPRTSRSTGGAVLASNHIGYLDFIFAGLGANPVRPLRAVHGEGLDLEEPCRGPADARHEAHPGRPCRWRRILPRRPRRHAKGEIVGIFPEATISRSFEIKDFKSGAARLAMDAGVPLIPHRPVGHPAHHDQGPAARLLPRQGRTRSASGHPSTYRRVRPRRGRARPARGHARHARRAIARYPQTPAGAEDQWWLPARHGGSAPTLQEATRMDRLEALERARRRTA